ncbi:MAG: hypothetical protein ABL974_13835 [Prosthecobacter sp.]
MTTAQGGTAIQTALDAELAEFAQLRAGRTELSQDDEFEVNVDLVAKIKARLLTDLDAAWSD